MRFAEPWQLLWALAIPALLLFFWYAHGARRVYAKRLGDPALIGGLTSQVSKLKRGLRACFFSVGVLLAVGALMRPQSSWEKIELQREGRDLVILIDTSRSMLAADVPPNRIDRARIEINRLLEKLDGDRVALISFAGAAFTQCPLTSDYGAVKLFLRSVNVGDIPTRGTSFAVALESAEQLLQSGQARTKARAVILITDGEDHSERTRKALDSLIEKNVALFTVSLGSPEGELIPLSPKEGGGYLRDRDNNPVMSRPNTRLLREMAEKGNGAFYDIWAGDQLDQALPDQLDQLEKEALGVTEYTDAEESYQWLLCPAILFFLGAALFNDRKGWGWGS